MRRSAALPGTSVLCKACSHTRPITPNNPESMNALKQDIVMELHNVYLTSSAPAFSLSLSLCVIKGIGKRAFCAGDNAISATTNNPPPGCTRTFFFQLYQIDDKVRRILAEHAALGDGYNLGGDVGVSVSSKYRVATEVSFATPEAAVETTLNVGGSWFLPQVSFPTLGMFTGLMGNWFRSAGLVHLGFAAYLMPSEKITQLKEKFLSTVNSADVESVVEKYAMPHDNLPPCTISTLLPFFRDRCAINEKQNLPVIVQVCRGHPDIIHTLSPTAMMLDLEVLIRGSKLNSFVKAFWLGHCAAQRSVTEPDFYKSVRVVLTDKCKQPKWKLVMSKEVSMKSIVVYFCPTNSYQMVWDPEMPPVSSTQQTK